jgi:hypothetical protein
MKTLLRCLALLAVPLLAFAAGSFVMDKETLAAVEAADARRVSAMLAGDHAALGEIFSDELYFVHATGKVDTKAAYIEALAGRPFSAYSYHERKFHQLAPGIVQMVGRNRVETRTGLLELSFLAIWRNEDGAWRFVSWHSTRPAPPAEKK